MAASMAVTRDGCRVCCSQLRAPPFKVPRFVTTEPRHHSELRTSQTSSDLCGLAVEVKCRDCTSPQAPPRPALPPQKTLFTVDHAALPFNRSTALNVALSPAATCAPVTPRE
eukprot:m.443457 g.443457  ORF g.443457 m.443457 type:complete len:112 (-) comp18968_c0_seq1:98-433(-)